jgi:hypothetical protein
MEFNYGNLKFWIRGQVAQDLNIKEEKRQDPI